MTNNDSIVEIHVTMPDGSIWAINAELVARDRATYFSEKASPEDGEKMGVFNGEYEYTMKDDAELADWAHNNMNWSDVAQWARQIAPAANVDFQEGWVNGDMRIVRKSKPAS